jgi:phospholipid/cholesterol/gamma-HCH transport system ATP-binding protein
MAMNAIKPAMSVKSLVYEVQGRAILKGLSLDVQHQEILAVMGHSGSGKTTLLKLIMGLLRPSAGEIWVEDREISRLKEEELLQLRTNMGYVFQNAALFDSLTVGENVAFGLRERRQMEEPELAAEVKEKLSLVGMEGTEKLMPAELSGGMRKRVGVARALVMEPKIILYDEPTAGLDPPTAHSLNELILNLREHLGVTSIIVSHDVPALAQVVDRAALLQEGKILAAGALGELAKSALPAVGEFFLFWKGE